MVLTYNLIIENHNNRNVISVSNHYETVTQSLYNYFTKETSSQLKSLKYYVYLLDHSYTPKGLSWEHLKNVDLLRAEVLKVAAKRLDLEIYLALADIQEIWDCEMDYDYAEYQRLRRKYSSTVNDNQYVDNIQVTGLIDSSTVLKYWIDQKNQPLNYKDFHVSGSCIGWTKANNKFQPFQSEYEGYMGNYGNTLDRWYHRAAIILWRKQDHYPMRFEIDPDSVINELVILTEKNSQEAQLYNIMTTILPYWSNYLQQHNASKHYLNVFKLALYINDPELAKTMIMDFDITALNPKSGSLFLLLQDLYGGSWSIEVV